MMSDKKSSLEEVETRRDDALRRALSTPPKPKRASGKESKDKDQD
jgi:hypothetical protein